MRGRNGFGAWANCGHGIKIATTAWRAGWHPIVPQLNGTWEMVAGELDLAATDGATGWLDYDFSLLARCDAIYRYPGYSEGADREVALMETFDKPVIAGPLEPSLEEFPKPTGYLEYVGGLWMRKRTGAVAGVPNQPACGVCGRERDNHNVRHPFVDGAYRAEGMRW
jgi:hypothetical protein